MPELQQNVKRNPQHFKNTPGLFPKRRLLCYKAAMPGKIYKIGEAAQLLGLKSYVLRFWESEFPQLNPTRTESGQRLYSEQDLDLLRRIRSLLHERGLTIEGARKVLNELQNADEGLSSDLLDEGYQDFFMAMDPESDAPGKRGDQDEADKAAQLATRQAAQRMARHMALSTGVVSEPRDAVSDTGPDTGPFDELSVELGEILAELKELRALLASPDSLSQPTPKV